MALAHMHGAVIAGRTGTAVTGDVSIQPRCTRVREAMERHRPPLEEGS